MRLGEIELRKIREREREREGEREKREREREIGREGEKNGEIE